MNELQALVRTHQDWLVARIIDYAKRHGYAADAPLLPYPWEASVCGLAEPLAAALEAPALSLDVRQGATYEDHPLTAFGITQAQAHRARGIGLADFLGLLKYYRRAHVDLLEHVGLDPESHDRLRPAIDGLFDLIEIGVVTEWATRDREARVAELQETNRRLASEKARYLTVFESLATPAVVVDALGGIETVNWAAARTFGEVGQTPGHASYQGAVPPALLAQADRLLQAGEHGREVRLETASGPRHFTVTARRLFDVTDQVGGQILLLHDVSDYVALREEAALVNRARSAFLATMSHEVRTPLNGILGAVELLRLAPEGPARDQALASIQASARVLLGLVEDILDHAKLEAAEVEVKAEPVRLADVVRTAARGLRLTLALAPEAEMPVLSDPAKLQRIVVNLLDNAIKFTLDGGVTIRLEGRTRPDGRLAATLEVEDTGIGVAPDRLQQLFDPFTQADPSIQDTFGGTGLGLAICRRLATLLGGRVEARSRPGEGSVFTFAVELPLADAPGPTPPKLARLARVPLRVLVVEDNDVNRVVTVSLLRHAGYEVVPAATGAAALAAARDHHLDAVVLDIRLPDADGLALAAELRATRPHRDGRLPIVVLTATTGEEARLACAAAGIDAYLTKPAGLAALDLTLQEVTAGVVGGLEHAAETVDRDRLQGHFAVLGDTALRTIVETFGASGRNVERLLLRVRGTADLPAVIDALHGLRGAAAQLGLVGIARACSRLEAAAGEGGVAALEAERLAFVQALARAQTTLHATIDDLTADGAQDRRNT